MGDVPDSSRMLPEGFALEWRCGALAMSLSHTGVRLFHSSPAASSLDFIGGPAILLGLVSLATDDHSMYAAVKVLHLVLTSNVMCDRLMQHICGYEVSPPSHPSLQMPPTTQQEAVIPEEQGGALLAQVDIPISMTFGESKLKVPWSLSITRAEGQVTTSQRGALIRMGMLTCLWLPTSFTGEFKNHLRSPYFASSMTAKSPDLGTRVLGWNSASFYLTFSELLILSVLVSTSVQYNLLCLLYHEVAVRTR